MRRLSSAAVAIVLVLLSVMPARADTRADARRYFQQGMALIDRGKHLEGIDLLKKAYVIRPHASVLFNIGRAYSAVGAVDPAIEYFERYLDSDPSDSDRVQQTLRDLKERKKLRALVDEGMTAIDEGRYTEGIALLKRAYETRPHPNILFNIARAYEDSHDYKHAIASYERYLKQSPQDSEEVSARLKRLRGLGQKKPAVKKPVEIARREREATEETRTDKGKRTKSEERTRLEERTKPEEQTKTPTEHMIAVPELDEAQMERLAQMIAQMVKKEPAERQAGSSAEGEAKEGRPEESEVGGAAPGSPVLAQAKETAMAEVSRPSTSSVGADAELEAKTDQAYEEVVVTASRREQSPLDAPNAVTIITDEDIRLSGARTIPELLRRVPGVDVMSMTYSDQNVAVRGFNRRIANKVLILIDGRSVYEDFLGGMLWEGQSISMLDISRIEVVRGPGSAIYGAYAYTGIINIITKRPEQIGGSVAQTSAGSGESINGTYQYGSRHGPIGVRASVGYERGNKYELEFDPHRVDYTTNASDPKLSLEQARFDAHAEYNFKGSAGRLYLGGGARSGFQELYGIAQIRNYGVKGQSYNLRGGYQSDLFSLQGFWNGLRTYSEPQFFPVGEVSNGSTVRADVISVEPVFRPTLSLLGDHAFVLGGEFRHKFIEWNYIDHSHQEEHFALFAQDSWTISPSVVTILSARLDLHPLLGPLGSPRLALIFKPAPRQALRVSVGTAFRQPTLAETYLSLSLYNPNIAGVAATLIGGHDALKPENIATVDVGYLVQPDFGELEIVAYANRVSNLIELGPLVSAAGQTMLLSGLNSFLGATSTFVNDARTFIALGGEVSTRLYPIEGVDVGANYAFEYISDLHSGARYTDSPMHKVNAWTQLRTSVGLDVGATVSLVSSTKWVEQTYDPTSSSGFNPAPLPLSPYVVIMGRVGYRMLDDKLELAVSGTNLADFGPDRHREHPFGNRVEARVIGSVTARF
jgi:iron complex outermembrane receptor protein